MIRAVLLAAAVCMDTFFAAIGCSMSRIAIPKRCALLVSVIGTAMLAVSIGCAGQIGAHLPPPLCKIGGAVLLCTIGAAATAAHPPARARARHRHLLRRDPCGRGRLQDPESARGGGVRVGSLARLARERDRGRDRGTRRAAVPHDHARPGVCADAGGVQDRRAAAGTSPRGMARRRAFAGAGAMPSHSSLTFRGRCGIIEVSLHRTYYVRSADTTKRRVLVFHGTRRCFLWEMVYRDASKA